MERDIGGGLFTQIIKTLIEDNNRKTARIIELEKERNDFVDCICKINDVIENISIKELSL